MTTGIIIQARWSSTRLEGKVCELIGETTILENIVATCCTSISDKVIVAISTDNKNDKIIDLINSFSFKYPKLVLYKYYGKDEDVLSRYFEASKSLKIDKVVRCTGDCPFISKDILNLCIILHEYYNVDIFDSLLIDGLDVQVISYNALEKIYNEATTEYDREHVFTYAYSNKDNFNIKHLSEVKLSVDYKKDLEFIRELFLEYDNYDKNYKIRTSLDALHET